MCVDFVEDWQILLIRDTKNGDLLTFGTVDTIDAKCQLIVVWFG